MGTTSDGDSQTTYIQDTGTQVSTKHKDHPSVELQPRLPRLRHAWGFLKRPHLDSERNTPSSNDTESWTSGLINTNNHTDSERQNQIGSGPSHLPRLRRVWQVLARRCPYADSGMSTTNDQESQNLGPEDIQLHSLTEQGNASTGQPTLRIPVDSATHGPSTPSTLGHNELPSTPFCKLPWEDILHTTLELIRAIVTIIIASFLALWDYIRRGARHAKEFCTLIAKILWRMTEYFRFLMHENWIRFLGWYKIHIHWGEFSDGHTERQWLASRRRQVFYIGVTQLPFFLIAAGAVWLIRSGKLCPFICPNTGKGTVRDPVYELVPPLETIIPPPGLAYPGYPIGFDPTDWNDQYQPLTTSTRSFGAIGDETVDGTGIVGSVTTSYRGTGTEGKTMTAGPVTTARPFSAIGVSGGTSSWFPVPGATDPYTMTGPRYTAQSSGYAWRSTTAPLWYPQTPSGVVSLDGTRPVTRIR